jgi:ribosomal protein L32
LRRLCIRTNFRTVNRMSHECPLCNGMARVNDICPHCGHGLDDNGRLEDFFGPYAPYGEQDMGEFEREEFDLCVHLLACPRCGYDIRTGIMKAPAEELHNGEERQLP